MTARWILPGLGLAATLAAARWLPAGADPALRATLAGVPLVVALLETLRGHLRARRAGGGEILLGAAWVAVALHASWLGIESIGRPLFAAFVLLVGRRVVALVPALRREMARGRTRSLAATALLAGLAVLPWIHQVAAPDGDEPYFVLLTESLTRDGDFDLANQYESGAGRAIARREIGPQLGDPVGRHGEIYSRHLSALPWLLVPGWWLGGLLGVRLTILLVWAIASERLARVALALGASPRGALRAWLCATFTAPLAVYASGIWVEVFALLATAIVLEAWAVSRDRPLAAGDWTQVGLSLIALPLLKLRFVVLAAPLALVVLLRRGVSRWIRVGALVALVGMAGAFVLHNYLLVGRTLRVYDLRSFLTTDLPQWAIVPRFLGIFFDGAFGLFAVGPIWLLALPGTVTWLRRRRDSAVVLAAVVPYLVIVASIREWYGAWGPPFRLPLAVLPALIGPLAVALERRPRGLERWLRPALLAISFVVALTFVVEPGWTRSFADGRGRLVDLLAAPLGADLARFVPSFVRWRSATLWATLAALGLVAATRLGRGRARRWDAGAGVALVLLGMGVWVAAARLVPTTIVEAEDPWIEHQGGALFPPLWQPNRSRFIGAWWLSDGSGVTFVPVSGGERVTVALRLRPAIGSRSAMTLTVARDGTDIGAVRVEPSGSWRLERLGPVEWKRGARLEVHAASASRLDDAALELDRIELEWR